MHYTFKNTLLKQYVDPNMLCAKFIRTNTSLLLFECTLTTSCEKSEVTSTSHEHGKAVQTGRAAHSPKHIFSEADYVVPLSFVFFCIHSAT